ncbi:MAG: nuclear transport factor 2 family protein, partial [Myxococcaceae bacterium]
RNGFDAFPRSAFHGRMKTDAPESLIAIARQWLACFETHDVDALVSLYAENARHTSPKLRVLMPQTDGCIVGRTALREWWADAFRRLPQLRYIEQSVTANGCRVFLEYIRRVPGESDMRVAEAFDIEDGLIRASRVYHG